MGECEDCINECYHLEISVYGEIVIIFLNVENIIVLKGAAGN